MCKSNLSYKTSSSNLKKHIQKKHFTVTITFLESKRSTVVTQHKENSQNKESIDNDRPSTSEVSSVNCVEGRTALVKSSTNKSHQDQTRVDNYFRVPPKISVRSKHNLDKKLLGLFIKDIQPFSVVDDIGFREFVLALNPSYELPSRHIISKTLIPALYEECLTNTKTIINTGRTFCITTDAWTTINNVSYVGVTAHFLDSEFNFKSILLECSATDMRHTAENLAEDMKRVTRDWQIENRVIFAVADNAPNIQKALQQIGWRHMGCVAHTINLIVKDGIKNDEILSVLEKIREIVSHFKKSTISNNKLMKY
ncbi:unnamed protein product [Acanthoscelides obtectus]|uniref:Zinc finger BED domain-containing protein 1-like n=1 Tax=Acanthoscelides obtectus TaxID=200917 RepID=A0A9P0LZP9_ACAOB|nr:unnamed protein product [Acanthoscelides obtectus]CAK1687736.1 Zinc finger BED domain-containing protein 1 [Acanthoscelides obtectus]